MKSHETLQRIVAENAVAAPATDVIVYGFQYTGNDQVFMMFNGSDKTLISDDRDDERRERVFEEPIDDKQMTQIVEAALIRYFQTVYNKNFKKVFPSQSHNFLADIKDLDYDGFVVELNTEDLDTKLFSDVVDPGLHHIVKFKMTARSTHPVFGFFGLMEDTGLDPQSGPIF
ncbi:hypothetical protein NFO65_15070 [Neorhizobium galegae]|uniref:hypothetical protein n=1 Tax=Neorhizobium galegae TaxID=399 RepID=UPI002101CF35|nr:hypothetical protein [Neorhizobium galegae]MCQ1572052.1 hypothetical protein [Neorhizobium galegae]